MATDGTQGNGLSMFQVVSADGRYVAFQSSASNLVAGDTNNATDVFVRDVQAGTTTRVSVAGDGTQGIGSGGSSFPSISADGRYVAFASSAANLVAGDTNGVQDAFVRDVQTGTTTRVSLASDGTQSNATSNTPKISADGRYVIYASSASNLVAGDTNNGTDVFMRDTQTGTTTCVSLTSTGALSSGIGGSVSLAISGDGRYVVFLSAATDLVAGDTNNAIDVFVRDVQAGTTTRASVSTGGVQSNSYSEVPSISADGRYVAFGSMASTLAPGDTNGRMDVFVRDLQAGTTTRVNVADDGTQTNNGSNARSISGDGRYVAFASLASNLVAGDTNNATDVFVRDVQAGTTTRESLTDTDDEGNNTSNSPWISADGRHVSFASTASNLVAGDTNNVQDIFVRHRPATTTTTTTTATATTTASTTTATTSTGGDTSTTTATTTDGSTSASPSGSTSPTVSPSPDEPGAWVAKTVKFGDVVVPAEDVVALSSRALKVVTPAYIAAMTKTKAAVVVTVGDATKGPKYTYVGGGVSVETNETCTATSEDTTEGGAVNPDVTLVGTGFTSTFTKLLVGGKAVKTITVASDGTSIRFAPPNKVAGIQDLVVSDKRVGALFAGYCTYRGIQPTITGVSSTKAIVEAATEITVTGTNLDKVKKATFGAEKATFKVTKGSTTEGTVKIAKGTALAAVVVLETKYEETAETPTITRAASETPTVTGFGATAPGVAKADVTVKGTNFVGTSTAYAFSVGTASTARTRATH